MDNKFTVQKLYTDGCLQYLAAFASAAWRTAKIRRTVKKMFLRKESAETETERWGSILSIELGKEASNFEVSTVAGAGQVAEWLVNCRLLSAVC